MVRHQCLLPKRTRGPYDRCLHRLKTTRYCFAREGMSRDCHGLVILPVRVPEDLQSGQSDHARRDANEAVCICLIRFSAGRDEIGDRIPASSELAGSGFSKRLKTSCGEHIPQRAVRILVHANPVGAHLSRPTRPSAAGGLCYRRSRAGRRHARAWLCARSHRSRLSPWGQASS
jgi:hypothetical protein